MDSTGAKVVETAAFLIEKVIMRSEPRYEDALALCAEMLVDYPTHARLYSLKGYVLFKLNRSREAVESFDIATQSKMMLPQTFYYLGMSYSSLGDTKAAQRALETAMELDTNYEDVAYQLARVLYLNGAKGKKKVEVENM